jgi:hypothetical protein
MSKPSGRVLAQALWGIALAFAVGAQAQSQAPRSTALDRFKALSGEWVDADGALGMKGKVAASYQVTGAGSAVIERLFVGQPHEMTTVYHLDGADLVLTHYCAAGNQPRMRARKTDGALVFFEFDGGTNFDPARDMHMHEARIEFIEPDEIRQSWQSWKDGKPAGHAPSFRLARKPPG